MLDIENSPLIRGAGDLWTQATRARFLDAVADGTLPAEAFHRWLVQDYQFARGLTSYQAIMVARAPREAHAVLIGGLSAMNSELEWFEQHADRLSLELAAPAHPTCRRYVDFLLAAAYTRPFPELAVILFGVEVSYLAAWSALPAEGPHAEFITRWSNPHFAEYVGRLATLANRETDARHQAVFDDVLRLERDFWHMTWEA